MAKYELGIVCRLYLDNKRHLTPYFYEVLTVSFVTGSFSLYLVFFYRFMLVSLKSLVFMITSHKVRIRCVEHCMYLMMTRKLLRNR